MTTMTSTTPSISTARGLYTLFGMGMLDALCWGITTASMLFIADILHHPFPFWVFQLWCIAALFWVSIHVVYNGMAIPLEKLPWKNYEASAKHPLSPASVAQQMLPAQTWGGLLRLKKEKELNQFARLFTQGRPFTAREAEAIAPALAQPGWDHEKLLQAAGCDVVLVKRILAAIEQLEQDRPDIFKDARREDAILVALQTVGMKT
ncbi:MAG: hypothetical protein COY40_00280 [Alphaproteobacteria bacterium CG_4_10_14_0_8_um_filter_53_9]|nr:MAG: hypothetical protein COY40_00280 [Alphaproteobacteria bacterium CG_4_10_14_0_8_um_filter_53_9]